MKTPDTDRSVNLKYRNKYEGLSSLRCLLRLCFTVAIAAGIGPPPTSAAHKGVDPKHISFLIEQMSTDMRYEISSLQYLLEPGELLELLKLRTDYARVRWIREFWESQDPVFTTKENERLTEHKQRVAYAESNFYIPRWPMWDQRGEVYIRFGPPDFRKAIEPKTTIMGPIPKKEIWYYGQFDMYVLFEDALSNGEYTCFLKHIRAARGMSLGIAGDGIDAPVGKETILPPRITVESRLDLIEKKLNNFTEVARSIRASSRYQSRRFKLPFVFQAADFRGGASLNRVDVNIEFSADSSAVKNKEDFMEYTATAVCMNTDKKEIGRDARSIKIPTPLAASADMRLIPTQLTFSLPPGFYFLAVTMEEKGTGRLTSYRKDITCRDFENNLSVSDVLFARKITPAKGNSMFNRGAIQVVPHPLSRYRKPVGIPVYFEVYNLFNDQNGSASYTVEYRIVSRQLKKAGFWGLFKRAKPLFDISSSFQAACRGGRDQVHIDIGSDNFDKGEYTLNVIITDNLSGNKAEREADFTILE